MSQKIVFLLAIIIFVAGMSAIVGNVSASPSFLAPTPQPTPAGRVATAVELEKARAEWMQSAHADTYDDGMGANATCARCKSPRNWNENAPAAAQALDCSACKRIPGAPRPDLESGVPVAQADWMNIGCEVCHQPAGNSYYTALSYWDNTTQTYAPIHDSTELCAKCHEGQHGFEVIEEQTVSPAHQGWACTRCHGAHGTPASCRDCHNPASGRGASEHVRHKFVNCTACHDAGGLSVGLELDPVSRHAARHEGTYITLRFAHTLTAWPSHNLQLSVDCRRCHHPQGKLKIPIAERTGCGNSNCHLAGASLYWCPIFPRDKPPTTNP